MARVTKGEVVSAQPRSPSDIALDVRLPTCEPEVVDLPTPGDAAIKAEDWQQEPAGLPWQVVRCRECNKDMWTRMPDRHDICEGCGYNLRVQIHEMGQQQIQHRTDTLLNPFADGGLNGLMGSLPNGEK